MTRTTALKIVNPILGILALNQIVTGLFGEDLPPETFEILHEGGGILFAVTALIHLALNWGWVRSNFTTRGAAPAGRQGGA